MMRLLTTVIPAGWRLLVLSLVVACGHAAEEVKNSASSAKFDLFLLAGQSNMAGRAPVEAFDQLVWPTLFSLDAAGQWVPASEPLHFDKPARVGVGPGLAFGRIVAEARPGTPVGLIPAAVGGSSIVAWAEGAQHPQTRTYPYDDAVRRARLAMDHGRLRAILWIQGESDATETLASAYYDRLVDLIARFRRDLGDPELPFIIGQRPALLGGKDSAWRAIVDAAQRRAAREIAQVRYVEVPPLVALPDQLHFDAPSAREVGRRLAQRYLSMDLGE